jgi:hypothetical protein
LPIAYPNLINRASDYTCIVFIFLFGLGYSLSLGPTPWVYGSEVRTMHSSLDTHRLTLYQIFPTKYRAIGLNFAASNGALGSILTSNIWPVGIENIGSKTFLIFFALNVACLPVIYFFYPETTKQSLEGLEALFKDGRANSLDGEAESVDGGVAKAVREV